ncbi:MAG: diguanylate cyclase domain-containing protein [Roseateles sp.]|uniref:diguanylate cyclase domain-containing protein n=1 Tax=Roseateles sp. TaxID=1971397 RepID=UPI004036EBEE
MPQTSSQQLVVDMRRFRRYLALGNVLILAIVATATVLAASASYRAQEQRARDQAAGLAQTLALGVASTIALVDHTLQSTLYHVEQQQARGPLNAAALTQVTAGQRALVPSINALRVTDADGWVLNPDAGGPARVSVADRDYFRAARAEPARLAVSEPLQGRLKAGWGLVFARARLDASGRFAGVVYAGIGTETFTAHFQQADVGAQGAVSLRARSLKLIARYSPQAQAPEAGLGKATVSEGLVAALAASPARGSYVARTALDGVERVTAYTEVPGYPLLMLVGLGTEDFFAPWQRQVVGMGSLLLLLAIVLIGASVALYRAQARQVQARARIALLAAERGAMLDSELVGMVKLRERQEIWHNPALARLFGYGPGELCGQPARLLYLDDASFAQVGLAYQHLGMTSSYRTQLQMRRKDGSAVWVDLSGAPLPDGESLWLMTDITAIKRSEEQARHLAFHDVLTGLPNRHLLQERLAFLLRDAERNGRWLAVCYMDLDGFKAVNDSLGHDAGDAVLRAAAARLSGSVRGNDIVARMGGDEFVLVLNQSGGLRDEKHALNRLLDSFAAPVTLPDGAEVRVGVSIGVAIYPLHGREAGTLISRADHALLAGKRAGKGRWVAWEPSVEADAAAAAQGADAVSATGSGWPAR